ncbi:MAG: DUF4252 domain-containing protein [Bacteroidota bacterium]
MKTASIVLMMIVLPFLGFSQNRIIQNFFDAFSHEEDYSVVNISGSIFNFANQDKKKDDVIIKGLHVLTAPKGTGSMRKSDIDRLARQIKRADYETLMEIRDGNTCVHFMIKERGRMITELVMIADGEENFSVMSLNGLIPRKKLRELEDDIDLDIDGVEFLRDAQY